MLMPTIAKEYLGGGRERERGEVEVVVCAQKVYNMCPVFFLGILNIVKVPQFGDL